MKLKLMLTGSALLFVAACGAETDTTETTTSAVEEKATEEATTTAAAADATVEEAPLCLDAGPQTPRDISNVTGLNTDMFQLAPASTEMNLCNIHSHTNAEHKGPGFSVFVNDTDSGGYACNGTADLTEAELAEPTVNAGAFGGVKPGDTIEVHWVHTSCDIQPGEGLGSCLSDTCTDPLLRVEAQTFLVVNDGNALNWNDFTYDGNMANGLHQPKAIPSDTGTPVVFRGSTTGPSYDQSKCSPLKVTWSVRPQCAKLDINSLNEWAANGNVFNESASHGVRQLVTAPELLSPIE